MADLDTKLLRSFLSVSGERSFSRAAERLGCSQATMSLRIRTLEDQLGRRLFARSYHDVQLTAAGRDLLEEAQQMVDLNDMILARARASRVAGAVRLGIAEDYVAPMLPALLKRLGQVYPGIELSIASELSVRLRQQIRARTLDLAIVTLPQQAAEGATVLSEPQLHWVGAPDLALSPEQPLPLAVYPEGCAFRQVAEAALRRAGRGFRIFLTSASGRVIQGAVAAGAAVTVMAEGTVPEGMRILRPEAGLPVLPASCIQILDREGGLSEAAARVKQEILRQLQADR